ncbi:MAG: hypothetical protein HDP34_04220 [Clostridia bacterium]|nr:hypothetical protein [Clostridia bacterium]
MFTKFKCKRILRFYFFAEKLNDALDNLIYKHATAFDGYHDGTYYAEKICELIGAKRELSELWQYLDGIMEKFTKGERAVLRFYGSMRCGIKKLSEENRREVKRVTVKFSRRAKLPERFNGALKIVADYYCLLGVSV